MANTVKLFQSVQGYFHQMGIYPTRPNQAYSFNWTSFWIVFSMIVSFIPSTGYFFLKAQTIDEYLKTFYASSSTLAFLVCFLVNIWKMTVLFKLIASYEKFISKSNFYNSTIYIVKVPVSIAVIIRLNFTGARNSDLWIAYKGLNIAIERMSKFLHFLITRLTVVGLIIPSLLITITNYFIYDLGTESYYLSCPYLCVWKCKLWIFRAKICVCNV